MTINEMCNTGRVPCRTLHRRRKRGGGGKGVGGRSPNNLRGGGNIPFGPPNNPPTFPFNFYVKKENITNIPS